MANDSLLSQSMPLEEEEDDELLFYMILVIELQDIGQGKKEPLVAYRLPNLWEQDPYSKNVASFCFPDTSPFPTTEMENERFSFVLTEDDGDRRFGYCLRKLAQGTGLRMPICFVVLTYLPCDPLYNKILDRIAYHYENSSGKILTQFLESVVQNKFPAPGETFSVEIHDDHLIGGSDRWTLTRPESDLAFEQLPVEQLLVTLSSVNVLRIFTSLLIERRVIFCAKKISTLSNIVKVMMALIYPFSWQHIFIPILPATLLSYCCAPMPFVVGILQAHLDEVTKLPMDEVLIVTIDDDSFLRIPEDDIDSDIKLLPQEHHTELLKQLKHTRKLIKRANAKKSKISLRSTVNSEDVTIAIQELQRLFLSFFVDIMGPAYLLRFSGGKSYSVENFIESSPIENRPFLEQFTCSQMFERFIRLQLFSESNKNPLFERNIRSWLRKHNYQPAPEYRSRFNYPISCVSSVDPQRGMRSRPTVLVNNNSVLNYKSKIKSIPQKGLPPLPKSINRESRSSTLGETKSPPKRVLMASNIWGRSIPLSSSGSSPNMLPPSTPAPLPPTEQAPTPERYSMNISSLSNSAPGSRASGFYYKPLPVPQKKNSPSPSRSTRKHHKNSEVGDETPPSLPERTSASRRVRRSQRPTTVIGTQSSADA